MFTKYGIHVSELEQQKKTRNEQARDNSEQLGLTFQVRNKSYKDLQDKLGLRQMTVLEELSRHEQGATNYEIKQSLGLEINQVTGRTKELNDLGFIIPNGTKINEASGKPNTIYIVSEKGKQLLAGNL